jgi:hypothetical protein
MKILKRCWKIKPWAGFIFSVFFLPVAGFAQGACQGLPPPDRDLYLIPNRVLQSYDFSGDDIIFIHDYGQARLAYLPDIAGMPANVQSQITALREPASVSFRSYTHTFKTPDSASAAGLAEGFRLLALYGPFDQGLMEMIRACGVLILDTAHPYGLLVKADWKALDTANPYSMLVKGDSRAMLFRGGP